jgi:hypothetical protein
MKKSRYKLILFGLATLIMSGFMFADCRQALKERAKNHRTVVRCIKHEMKVNKRNSKDAKTLCYANVGWIYAESCDD